MSQWCMYKSQVYFSPVFFRLTYVYLLIFVHVCSYLYYRYHFWGGGGGGGASYKSITAVTDYMGFSFTCRPRRSQRGDTPLLLGTTSTSSSTRRGCSLNSRKLAEGTLARSSKGVYNVMYPFLLSCVCVCTVECGSCLRIFHVTFGLFWSAWNSS